MRIASRSGSRTGSYDNNYLANVSDLVAAFIFVFMIMLAVFAHQLATQTKKLEEETRKRDEVRKELMAADEARLQILQDIATQLRHADLTVEVLADQGILRLSENTVNFPSGGETPLQEHHANVGRLAHAIGVVASCYAWFGELGASPGVWSGESRKSPVETSEFSEYCYQPTSPPPYECRRLAFRWRLETLLIEGHTDTVPVAAGKRFHDNLELSSMRAATVHRMLTACEPGLDNLRNRDGLPILSTSGYGHTRPATNDPERFAANRRIDLRLLLEPTDDNAAKNPIQVDLRERYREG